MRLSVRYKLDDDDYYSNVIHTEGTDYDDDEEGEQIPYIFRKSQCEQKYSPQELIGVDSIEINSFRDLNDRFQVALEKRERLNKKSSSVEGGGSFVKGLLGNLLMSQVKNKAEEEKELK